MTDVTVMAVGDEELEEFRRLAWDKVSRGWGDGDMVRLIARIDQELEAREQAEAERDRYRGLFRVVLHAVESCDVQDDDDTLKLPSVEQWNRISDELDRMYQQEEAEARRALQPTGDDDAE